MGVYVKGMNMPKNCYHCPMHDHDDTGIMCVYLGRLTEDRPIDCPLIEIDQEDEKAVLYLLRMRKAMREGKSWREFLDEERRADE